MAVGPRPKRTGAPDYGSDYATTFNKV